MAQMSAMLNKIQEAVHSYTGTSDYEVDVILENFEAGVFIAHYVDNLGREIRTEDADIYMVSMLPNGKVCVRGIKWSAPAKTINLK